MRHCQSAPWSAAVLLAGLAVGPVHADKLTRGEIAQRGKAACAVVLVAPNHMAGTAFCVHPDGYFLAAESALAGAPVDSELALVLDPGLKTQKVLKAHIVRRDPDGGATLLRADGCKDLPSLPLGSADKLSELAELVTLSYPIGSISDKDKMDYPSITVDVGTVTTLNRKDGELTSFTLKGLTEGLSAGGPALDENAAVVGLLQKPSKEGVRAVSVNRLAPFLAEPDIRLAGPTLTRANLHEPAEFRASVVSVVPPARPWAVELVLRAGAEPERRLPMEPKDGVYRATAVPVPADAARRLEVSAQFESGAVAGLVEDRDVQVGARKVRLSALKRFQPSSRPPVVLADGKTLDGQATGLDKVEFAVGGQKVVVDLSRAASVTVSTPGPVEAVDCTVVVRQGDAEAGRCVTRLPVNGTAPVEPADLPVETAVKERMAVDLPEAFDQVKTGGGGRFLIFSLKNAKKLAILDVFQARIVHEIEVADDVRYAAGRDKLLVVSPGQKTIQRYDLHTFEREKTVPVPGGATVVTVLMGSDSPGPLGLWCGGNLILMDVDRMEVEEVPGNNFSGSTQYGFGLRVSADGQTFVGWNPGLFPTGFAVMHLASGKAKTASGSLGGFNEQWLTPNADGSLLLRYDSHLASGDAKPISADGLLGWMLLPTEDPRFFLAARGVDLSVCTSADRRPVFTLKDPALEKMNASSSSPRWYYHQGEPCVHYLPRANLLVFLPNGNKQVVVRPFDLMSELDKAGQDYLFVLSPPKTIAKAGAAYEYRMDVKSKAGELKYKLESGPDGMTVSGAGEVRWDAPSAQAGKTVPVIVNVRDAAGKELFHSFEVTAE